MQKSTQKNKLSENLKRLRSESGLSQDRLSKLSDLSLNTIVLVENGTNENPTIATITKIVTALGVSIDDLIK